MKPITYEYRAAWKYGYEGYTHHGPVRIGGFEEAKKDVPDEPYQPYLHTWVEVRACLPWSSGV